MEVTSPSKGVGIILKMNNKGLTLIELIVAFAILALIATGIVGVMSSNSVLFRKTKKDINISTSAQETYGKISEDLMQAQYVYIEGKVSSSLATFPTNKTGADSSIAVNDIKLLRKSDINMLKHAGLNGGLDVYFSNLTTKPNDMKAAVSDNDAFNSYYNKFRYMSDVEKDEYKRFLSNVPAGTYKNFEDTSLYDSTTDTFNNIYISKIILMYSVPIDSNYVPTGVVTTGKELDYCIETITVSDNKIYISSKYHYMTELDSTSDIEKDLYASDINYVVNTSGTDVANLSGVVAKVDGAKDTIMLDIYFAKYSMSYQDKGMTVIRNSYVLHDAK